MKKIYYILYRLIPGIFSAGLFLYGCGSNSMRGMIICTQVKPAEIKIDPNTGGNWRYFDQSRIVALSPSKPGVIVKVLTTDFFAARSPEISFDGNKMLFAGQRNQGDPWQIYEMILGKNKARQVIRTDKSCTDPSYLPDGKIIFSMAVANDKYKSGTILYSCGLDGCCLSRITWHPNADFASSVLNDGRVVMISWQLFPDPGKPQYMVLRPDGTKSELYYPAGNNTWLNGKISECDDGHVYFVESDNSPSNPGRLISLKTSRPLSSEKEVSENINGSFYSVYPGIKGKLLVSYRESASEQYGIYEFDPIREKIGDKLLADQEYNSIEPVLAIPRSRPRNLPTELIPDSKSGLLMCMNTDYSNIPAGHIPAVDNKTLSVRVLGVNGLIREIPVEQDGSFYIDISSDIPFRFETVDEKGEIVRGPSSWIWMRPNERRGCIGCHENRELAPDNRVALAIKKMPVEIKTGDAPLAVKDYKVHESK